jgi:hypothetical protein
MPNQLKLLSKQKIIVDRPLLIAFLETRVIILESMLLNLHTAELQLSEAFAGRDRSTFMSCGPVNILQVPQKYPISNDYVRRQ